MMPIVFALFVGFFIGCACCMALDARRQAKGRIQATMKTLGFQIGKFELKPSDKFVLVFKERLSSDAVARIKETMKQFTGGDRKTLVLEAGAEIAIVRDAVVGIDGGAC